MIKAAPFVEIVEESVDFPWLARQDHVAVLPPTALPYTRIYTV